MNATGQADPKRLIAGELAAGRLVDGIPDNSFLGMLKDQKELQSSSADLDHEQSR